MSFSVAIVGLPNTGKSTLFKALTKQPVNIAAYPFTTISPNVGVVLVPDERLEKISQVIKPEKVTPTVIEFVDIAGLVKGAHKGEGLGNQFLAQIRNCDAILEVARAFSTSAESQSGEDQKPQYQLWERPCPERDIETVKVELLMKDLETLESVIPKLEKEAKAEGKNILKKLEVLKNIKDDISQGKLISEMNLTDEKKAEIKELQFLTAKPILYILNTDRKSSFSIPGIKHLVMNLKEEEEIAEFSEAEVKELDLKSQLDQLIVSCYNVLDLITFFTVAGGKETRAWTIKAGSKVLKAAGQVHSDFEEKFIKAEVIDWKSLVEAGGWQKAKEKGWLRTVGKDYIVQDGEVIEFKI
jgi:hypothetical protein